MIQEKKVNRSETYFTQEIAKRVYDEIGKYMKSNPPPLSKGEIEAIVKRLKIMLKEAHQ